MNINDYRLLGVYNKEVNKEMNGILKTLTDEEWNKNFEGYYKSIRELGSHIYIADYKWFAKFMAPGEYACINPDFFAEAYSYSDILFADLQEYLKKRAELDDIIVSVFNELQEADLDKILQFTNIEGLVVTKKLKTYLLHLSHHQTHHRGMIALYLDILGKENSFSRLYTYGE